VIVQAEVAAAPRDVEPAVVVDLQPRERRQVVAVQFADDREQLVPAESLQLLHRRIGVAEQIEVALEQRLVTVRERARIGLPAALGREHEGAQRRVQPGRIRMAADPERHREQIEQLRSHRPSHGSPLDCARGL
jgi:hypothetical protein